MADVRTLLLTDIVDSTQLNERLGDATMARLWAEHDALARALLRQWRGREVGRSDGFLLLFDAAADAVAFAMAYHDALSQLAPPLQARVGMHTGAITLRENRHEDTAQGATPFEIDGVALPLAARVMSVALGGQTLLTDATLQAMGAPVHRVVSHGHWRLKGLSEPLELLEIGTASARFAPPPDSAKAYRVVRRNGNWTTLGELPNRLPAERDLFVGRQASLAALGRAFDDGARLVTLLGMGGIGKTRLALHHARCWLGDYPGGAWFCDLGAARGIDGIVHAVAQGLQTPLGKGDAVHELALAIAGRGPCLVILDNFEQVARHAEATLGAWLERAPQARFIATSREVLGIVGEQTLVLAPLGADEAAQLFRQHLHSVGGDRPLTAEDEAAIPPLMELLDRLPLAIELAAARTRVLPPHVLLKRMGERFKLLAARGGRIDRQATMRAALDWSWDLLSSREREVLAQLSVFEGGFELDAAEAVVDAQALAGDWLPDLLQSLVEKSLLRVADGGRFEMLRTVHDYAAERLQDGGSRDAAEARHWRHFAAMDEMRVGEHWAVEVENLVLACRRASGKDTVCAARLLGNAWAALRLTGPFGAALELTRRVEESLPANDGLHAVVQRVRGAALSLLGESQAARGHYAQAIAIAGEAGDGDTQAQAQCLLADLEMAQGNGAAAEELLAEVEASPAAQANPLLRFMALNVAGKLQMGKGQWAAARSRFERALELARHVENRRWVGGLEGNLGLIARAEGHREQARAHWQRGLQWAGEVADRQWAGNMHSNLGLLLHELGEAEAARAHLQIALGLARTMGHRRLEATALCNLGLVADALGDVGEACRLQAQAAQIAADVGSTLLQGQARGYLGVALSAQGQHEHALQQIETSRVLLAALSERSALALLGFQAAFVLTRAGQAQRAKEERRSAQDRLDEMGGSIDPEIAAMQRRADEALRRA